MKKAIISACALVCLFSTSAMAEEKDPIKIEMTGHLVTISKKGKEVLTPLPKESIPGQIVLYTLNGKNQTKKTLTNVAFNGKIPIGTNYVADSAKCKKGKARYLFAFDGGVDFKKEPIKEIIKNKKGEEEEKIISPKRYSQVNFVFEKLKGKKKISCSYKIKIK